MTDEPMNPRYKRHKLPGRAKAMLERNATAMLAADGSRVIAFNWKKRTMHYIDKRGNKKTGSIPAIRY